MTSLIYFSTDTEVLIITYSMFLDIILQIRASEFYKTKDVGFPISFLYIKLSLLIGFNNQVL